MENRNNERCTMNDEQLTRMTRGVRNCNQLNIKYSERNKWQGKVADREKKDQVFEEFRSMEYGLRAALKLISKYCIGGTDTPRAIISKWAPASADGNHTKEYIEYVERRMKQLLKEQRYALSYDPRQPVNFLNKDVMQALLTAMSEFESRYTPLDFDFKAAWIMIYGRGV